MKRKVVAGILAVLMAVTLLGPIGGNRADAAVNYAQNAEKNGEIIKEYTLLAYMDNDKSDRSFYVYDTSLTLLTARNGITASNMSEATKEISAALNYLGQKYPGMSTPIFDHIELPPPRSGQSKVYFTLRKDAEAGEMVISQDIAKAYLTAHGVPSAKADFDDRYDLLKEIETNYTEAAYAALQVKAYEFFLYYAKKCTKAVTSLPSDGLIREEVVIPFSDFFNAFFDEPAFTPLFFEYFNLDDATEFRKAIMDEIYDTLWALCHNSAFWLDNGASNNSSVKQAKYGVPHSYDQAKDAYRITFTVSAVKETTRTSATLTTNLNIPVTSGRYEDRFGYVVKNVSGNTFKSIATMATEFDDRLHQMLKEVYREELSPVANEYAVYQFLRKYLNYGNLEGDDVLNNVIKYANVHIPYDPWVKQGSLMTNYSYAYTAVMNGNSICDGHVKAAQSLLMYIGIKSTVGNYGSLFTGGHVWNYVYFNGMKYILDVGPHRPYPIFNIGKSFASNNIKSDGEYTNPTDLGDEFAFLNDLYGSSGDSYLTTVQDGENLYYVDITDNCNVYRVKLSGTAKPVKVYTVPGDNSVRSIRNYILKNDGSTHEIVRDTTLLEDWNLKLFSNASTFASMEAQMKAKNHTNQEAWYYRGTTGLYYSRLTADKKKIYLNLKYLSNRGTVVDHLPELSYRSRYEIATLNNSTPYSKSTGITSTNRYAAGTLVKSGLVNGTISAPAGDSIERYTIKHNGVTVFDKFTPSNPSSVGLGTVMVSNSYMSYGEGTRTVLGKSKVFNAVELHAYSKKKLYNVISAKPVNAILRDGNIEYNLTGVSATAAGVYTIKLEQYNYATETNTKYTFSWNGKAPAKAGDINTMCRFNKEARTLMFVLENGEIRELKIPSNGKVFDNLNLHEYKAGQIDIFSATDWNNFASLTAKGFYHTGCEIHLQHNIDFKGGSISQLGSTAYKFADVFNGNGFSIRSGKVSNTGDFAGLFGYVGGAKIMNFTASNIVVNGRNYCGIVGYADNGSEIKNIRITDCTIKGKDSVGAVGFALKSTIANVFVTDRMGITGTSNVGGILGLAGPSMKLLKCYNAADISGTTCVGGILGATPSSVRNVSEDTVIRCCYNAGSVNASQSVGGGVVGYYYHSSIFRSASYVKAKVAGRY